jgi:hypothetical protein
MTRRTSVLILQVALVGAVCGLIAYLYSGVTGLVGAGVGLLILAMQRGASSPRDRANESLNQQNSENAEGAPIVYSQAPHCYRPGNPIYFPPDEKHDGISR